MNYFLKHEAIIQYDKMKATCLLDTNKLFFDLQYWGNLINFYMYGGINLVTSFFSTMGFEIKFGKSIHFCDFSKNESFQLQNGAKSQGVDNASQTDVEFNSENNIQKEIFSTNQFDCATQTEIISTNSTFSEPSNIGCKKTQNGFTPDIFHIKPPEFDSENIDVHLFFKKLEKYKILYSLNEADILKLIPNILDKNSLYFFDSLSPETRNNCILLRQQMITHYNTEDIYSTWAKLINRKQKKAKGDNSTFFG